MPDSKLDAQKYSSAPNEKHLLETQIQEKIDADTRTRQSDVLERMCLLAGKDHLGLGDWVEIVGIGIKGESNYTISNKGIFFNGWDQEFIDSHPLPHEQRLIRQNEEPGLAFPCTPTELLDFVDTGAGRLFGSFIVDDEFRRVVVEIERSLARAARLGSANSPPTVMKQALPTPPSGQLKGVRINFNRAFLLNCFEQGIGKNIESVWQHIRANAGKQDFLFRAASIDSASTIDEKKVHKKNLARTLSSLLKTTKTD